MAISKNEKRLLLIHRPLPLSGPACTIYISFVTYAYPSCYACPSCYIYPSPVYVAKVPWGVRGVY